MRYLPGEALPPYAYVPGRTPHPVSDPRGHSYGVKPAVVPRADPDHWQRSPEFLRGIDLFNHGYYWEAHEAWESLWHAAGRHGTEATFLKGLIKLAAAGVKAMEGRPVGVRRHAQRARELFEQARSALAADRASNERSMYFGLDLQALVAHAETVDKDAPAIVECANVSSAKTAASDSEAASPASPTVPSGAVTRVFTFTLEPR